MSRHQQLSLLASGCSRAAQHLSPATVIPNAIAPRSRSSSSWTLEQAEDQQSPTAPVPSTSGRGGLLPCRSAPYPSSWQRPLVLCGFAASALQEDGSSGSSPPPCKLSWQRHSTSASSSGSPDHGGAPSSSTTSTTSNGDSGGSSSGAGAPAAPPQPPSTGPINEDVEYLGPLASTHKLLKRISIANTAIALAAAPAIVMYAEVSYVSRIGLATSLVLFGLLTTGALHWITNPYVHQLNFHAATQSIDVRTSTLFGRTRVRHFKLSDVQPLPWNRPVATFMANGKFYYIDVYSFPNEELLRRLTPPEDSVPPGYKDDKDDD